MLDFIKGLWNPVAFWISFMMSIIMPIIFGLINTFVRDTGMKLAAKVFGFDPGY